MAGIGLAILTAVDRENSKLTSIFTGIASSVDEQMASTQEIARNTQEAALGGDALGRSAGKVKNTAKDSAMRMKSIPGLNQKLIMITRSVEEKSDAFPDAIRA